MLAGFGEKMNVDLCSKAHIRDISDLVIRKYRKFSLDVSIYVFGEFRSRFYITDSLKPLLLRFFGVSLMHIFYPPIIYLGL